MRTPLRPLHITAHPRRHHGAPRRQRHGLWPCFSFPLIPVAPLVRARLKNRSSVPSVNESRRSTSKGPRTPILTQTAAQPSGQRPARAFARSRVRVPSARDLPPFFGIFPARTGPPVGDLRGHITLTHAPWRPAGPGPACHRLWLGHARVKSGSEIQIWEFSRGPWNFQFLHKLVPVPLIKFQKLFKTSKIHIFCRIAQNRKLKT